MRHVYFIAVYAHFNGFIDLTINYPYATCTFPIMRLICPPKVWISIVFNVSLDGCDTQEKWKTKVMQTFGGQIRCIMGDEQVTYTNPYKLASCRLLWVWVFRSTSNSSRARRLLRGKFHRIMLNNFLFYRGTLSAFLWDDPDQDLWCRITFANVTIIFA